MLFIVMCKSVDFRAVSGDGVWQSVEACVGASLHLGTALPSPPSASFGRIWTLSGQIGSGLIPG